MAIGLEIQPAITWYEQGRMTRAWSQNMDRTFGHNTSCYIQSKCGRADVLDNCGVDRSNLLIGEGAANSNELFAFGGGRVFKTVSHRMHTYTLGLRLAYH
jgi:hypothetical protein